MTMIPHICWCSSCGNRHSLNVDTSVKAHLTYIASPTMGLPGGRDALEFVKSGDVNLENARYALELCITRAREALAKLDELDGEWP